MKRIVLILTVSLSFAISGCIPVTTYQRTFTDTKGRTVTCEVSGRAGLLTGYYLKKGFDDCVANTEANGATPVSDTHNTDN